MRKHGQDEILRGAEIMMENTVNDPVILAALSDYGYSQTRMEEGRKLLEETRELIRKYQAENGEQLAATNDMNSAWKTAEKEFMKVLKTARVALEKDVRAQGKLELLDARKQTAESWIGQSERFYTNIQSDPEFMAVLAQFNLTSERLTASYQTLLDFKNKNTLQKKEIGESQMVRIEKDQKMDALNEWISGFRRIARVALSDTPQSLEKLGITVLNAPRKKKTEGTATEESKTTPTTVQTASAVI